MNAETRQRILEELLRGGAATWWQAHEVLAELETEHRRYLEMATIQAEARERLGPEKHGDGNRPADVAERDLEARVVDILETHGIRVTDYAAGAAATILALVRDTHAEQPRNALRRARRRLLTLWRLNTGRWSADGFRKRR